MSFVDASEAHPAFLIQVSIMIYIYTLQSSHTDETVPGQNRLLAWMDSFGITEGLAEVGEHHNLA